MPNEPQKPFRRWNKPEVTDEMVAEFRLAYLKDTGTVLEWDEVSRMVAEWWDLVEILKRSVDAEKYEASRKAFEARRAQELSAERNDADGAPNP